jgi:ABC-type sugar transport system ATPase subunit
VTVSDATPNGDAPAAEDRGEDDDEREREEDGGGGGEGEGRDRDGGPRPLVEMRGIDKRFGRVVALSGVDLTLLDGEIHGLLGDNGSGKSTLIKTLVGVLQPDDGEIRIRGERVDVAGPQDARRYGMSTVYQDLALVDAMSVAANMFLDRYPTRRLAGLLRIVDWPEMNRRAAAIIDERLNLQLDPTAKVEFLSGGERQAVAIGRALVTDPDIVIMDEPTSALSADSAERVRELIRTLNEEGVTILLISHNLDEVFGLTHRVTVLDNGRSVGTVPTDAVSKDDVLRMMMDGRLPARVDGADRSP